MAVADSGESPVELESVAEKSPEGLIFGHLLNHNTFLPRRFGAIELGLAKELTTPRAKRDGLSILSDSVINLDLDLIEFNRLNWFLRVDDAGCRLNFLHLSFSRGWANTD